MDTFIPDDQRFGGLDVNSFIFGSHSIHLIISSSVVCFSYIPWMLYYILSFKCYLSDSYIAKIAIFTLFPVPELIIFFSSS